MLDGGQVESSLCTKLYRRELFAGLAERMNPAIKNNEDYLMNYFLFSRAKRSVYEDFCPYRYILRENSASFRQLNEHSLFDPIRVRELIVEDSGDEIREDARRALMRNLLVTTRSCTAICRNGISPSSCVVASRTCRSSAIPATSVVSANSSHRFASRLWTSVSTV